MFGYYIEVSKGQTAQVPETYIRKQTLTTGERYITPELKELERTILTAKDRITALEYELFSQVRQHLADQSARIQRTARAVAALDVLTDFAALAARQNYCRRGAGAQGCAVRPERHGARLRREPRRHSDRPEYGR